MQEGRKLELISKWLLPLRTSFTLEEVYKFNRDCNEDVAIMDELAERARHHSYAQEYFEMAKEKVVAAKPAVQATGPAVKVKSAAPAVKAKSAGVPREPKIASTAKIVWLVKENPKRAGSASHARFEEYFGTKTVEAYLAAGGTRADLANDTLKEYMTAA